MLYYEAAIWLLVHQPLSVHGAGGNLRSDVRRRGYAVRYIGNDVRYSGHSGTNEHLRNDDYEDGDVLTGLSYLRRFNQPSLSG